MVTDLTSGSNLVLGTDYTIVTPTGQLGAGNASVSGSGSATIPAGCYALQRVTTGHASALDYLQVTYQYTDPTYYQPTIFYDYADLVRAYGAPFNTATGAIQSELTLMAKFAFLNGAYNVVCAAVKPTGSGGAATTGDYTTALGNLENQNLVAVVCEASGQVPMIQQVQLHVDNQSANRYERRGICGIDGTTTAGIPTASQRISYAGTIQDSRVAIVCPTTFNYYSPELSKQVVLGGQYMAASLAGITVSQSFAVPLTRKQVTGWAGVNELEAEGQKNLESQNGLCVVELSRTGLIQVRHGVSTNYSSMLSREWSIVGQQDAMTYRLRDYLESDNLIGQPIYPYTLVNVKGSADAALQSLIRDGLIVDYTGLACRQLASNPDVLQVSFSWLPAFPLNYLVVSVQVSLTTGGVSAISGTSTNPANVTSAGSTTGTVGAPSTPTNELFGGASNTLKST